MKPKIEVGTRVRFLGDRREEGTVIDDSMYSFVIVDWDNPHTGRFNRVARYNLRVIPQLPYRNVIIDSCGECGEEESIFYTDDIMCANCRECFWDRYGV